MLRKIEIQNFMSLKKTTVDLEPLTVFVGANAAGKSAIFKALVTLSKLLGGTPLRGQTGEFSLESGVTLDDLVWGGNSGLPIIFKAWFTDDGNDDPDYTLELRKRAEGWSVIHERLHAGDNWIDVDEEHPFEHPTERHGTKSWKPPLSATLRYLVHQYLNDASARPFIDPILKTAEQLGSTWRYRPSANDIARFVKRPSGPSGARDRNFYVQENGWGVALELQALQGEKRDLFTAIENDLCTLFPHIRTIGFKTDWQGVRLSFMTTRSEDPIPAPQESDGVLLATFLLWRLYAAGPSMRVCLEEPESGLHPHLLGNRYQTLKKFAYPEAGKKPLQILVATHSPELLRTVKTHHSTLINELRVVDFDPADGTSVRSLSHYREAGHLLEKYGNLGDVWLSGGIGGLP